MTFRQPRPDQDGSPKNPLPSLSLPKGGGAIRGIGEKFSVNAATGTSALSVPLLATAGRAGFGPKPALSYDSGASNGIFGLGWNLSLPAVTRKTDKGLPRYLDDDESDVFLLSGAEDLVPVLDSADKRVRLQRQWHDKTYTIYLYRPRTEGLFARIERWKEEATGVSHWRTISRDNVVTLFGCDADSRIADADDPGRVFTYLVHSSYDNAGNVIRYGYLREDEAGIDTLAAHEANRDGGARRTQRYLKSIHYANAEPFFPDTAASGVEPSLPAEWHFKLVFDYGDHASAHPRAQPDGSWTPRPDPFSSYRAGFEIRTYRRCERVLLFHNFPDEGGVGPDCLVGSTDFKYSDDIDPVDPEAPVYTFLASITHASYTRSGEAYARSVVPPLEFSYSKPALHDEVLSLDDDDSRANLPEGIDGARFRWIDLNGEGSPGILETHDGAWTYKRNLGPLNLIATTEGKVSRARFGLPEHVPGIPAGSGLAHGARLVDVTGDGRTDVVTLAGPVPGFHARTDDEGWAPFQAFAALPSIDWQDPDLQFVDLTGDGLADVFVTEDDRMTYFRSLGADGYAPAEHVATGFDEDRGPHVMFADGTQTVLLADMAGDGLRGLVRVRNGEICYWPSLGYGRFGRKVTMDNPPRFTDDERFDPRRLRLADIDGSGTTDVLYVGEDGVHACFNRSGNGWADPVRIAVFPGADAFASVQVLDLLGNGTACLVWSSPLPAARRPLCYVDLMGSSKPHLLTGVRNNLGAETRIAYAPSTRFYLEDRFAGRPWITRLPFPVHCVARTETFDWIGRSRFVSRYTYRHGYYDGIEREFRGFGMVEQRDTEEHRDDSLFPAVKTWNEDASSFAPPLLTRTWFHNGAFREAGKISQQYEGEYWTEPGMRGDGPGAAAARVTFALPDSRVDQALGAEEMREAYRALKSMPLRVEVYAEDGSQGAANPYTVTEHNYTVRRVQGFGPNRHAVMCTSARESLTLYYERQGGDPRVTHDFTLESDEFGNVLRAVSVAYPRRAGFDAPEPGLAAPFRDMLAHDQGRLHVGATTRSCTKPVHTPAEAALFDAYRAPLAAETITAELTGFSPAASLFRFDEIDGIDRALGTGTHDIPYEAVSTPDIEGVGMPLAFARRVVEWTQVRYRSDDLAVLLLPGVAEAMGLAGETCRLAFTPGLIARVFGARVTDAMMREGGYLRPSGRDDWWVPSGRAYYSADVLDDPVAELARARAHFYRLRRAVDPFGAVEHVAYDAYDLAPCVAVDAVGNTTIAAIDYRVMQPWRTVGPNGNISEVAFDRHGHVAGVAVRGKAGEGDSLAGFVADLTEAQIEALRSDPLADPEATLGAAGGRFVHDLFAYVRTRDQALPDAPMLYSLARETHVSDLGHGQASRFRHVFAYWDGFGREAQHKTQAEPGPVSGGVAAPRWVGSGWTVYNNKGKAVRQYDPFFSATHRFEPKRQAGFSTVVFYDPLERIVATLHPDNTYEKTVFEAWRETAWDVNDTVAVTDARTDPDIGDYLRRWFGSAPGAFVSWHDARIGGTLGATPADRDANRDAAAKAAAHAATPSVAHLDALGRQCLSVADNGTVDGVRQRFATRTAFDTESKPLATFDALGRHLMEMCLREAPAGGGAGFTYVAGYAISGAPLYRNGMDDGERRTLENVAGNAIRQWDARGFVFRTVYDPLQRPTHRFVARAGEAEILDEFLVYGERHPDAALNLKGKLFRHYDGAGLVSNERYDFKDNVVQTARRFARFAPPATPGGTSTPNWSAVASVAQATTLALPVLDLVALDAAGAGQLDAADCYVAFGRFDALNRPIQTVTPHKAGGRPSVIQPRYNEANLLDAVDVWVRLSAAPEVLLDPATAQLHAIENIAYNAHGQRIAVDLGNGSSTTSTYDPLTNRLATLATTRAHADPDARTVQALSYTYDPKGNITRLRDDADIHNVVFFRNRRVEPGADYRYDALYRLTAATGREHLGQHANAHRPPVQPSNDDGPRMASGPGAPLPSRGDGNAMGNYTEQYQYDAVGNFVQMMHQTASGAWTRRYAYEEASAITPSERSNRLSATSLPGDDAGGPFSNTYDHDEHGNLTRMPHLPSMRWDAHGNLCSSSRQAMQAGTPETTHYGYDAENQRVRKLTARQAAEGAAPARRKERLYLGPIEIYREFDAAGTAVTLARETLHVMLDHQRVALVETRTEGTDPAPAQLVRYQYTNHLGSAILELDAGAAVVSYEEYFPYGATAYQAMRGVTEAPKRYRYTGKERDEENDLDYHGARYCAPWLGRWISCDPAGLADGPNVYLYVHCNPVAFSDPTGMWGWRAVAVVAAVVVVGTVVTVATAGVAGPIVAGAVASVGLSGAAATVATGVAVGAVAGAAGGAAGELTRQVASGESVSGSKIAHAAAVGAALGAVTGGVGAYASTANGAAQLARASNAIGASAVGRAGAAVGRAVASGARTVARLPGASRLASAAEGIGARAGAALQSVEQASARAGNALARSSFREGSRGAAAASAHAAENAAIGAERAVVGGPKFRKPPESTSEAYARLSAGARRIVKKLEQRRTTGLGSGVKVDDIRAASQHLGVEIGVVKSGVTGRLRALRGEYNGIWPGLRRPDEYYLFHTHPGYGTVTKDHIAHDLTTATERIEAVMDWAGNLAHFNKTGLITNPATSPINKLGYLTGN
jgi:RHS repeat-associated protein